MRLLKLLERLVTPALLIALSASAPEPDALFRDPARLAGDPAVHNCRLWGAISTEIAEDLILEHLLDAPYSMRMLSHTNPDGWGLALFPGGGQDPLITRGDLPAHYDPDFEPAVHAQAALAPAAAICHIRSCSSGLCDIADPHPFHREKHGRHWFMAHNGSIDKGMLLGLIEPDYFTANPPANGANETEWVDSELYFLYLLQTIEEQNWNVKAGLGEAIFKLRAFLPGDYHYLNILLTDGETLWGYREGTSLFYSVDMAGGPAGAVVASRYPYEDQTGWISLENGELITVKPDAAPAVEDIADYFDYSQVETPAAAAPLRLDSHPNPFNPRTTITCAVPADGEVTLTVHELNGRRLATLFSGGRDAGTLSVDWDGRDASGGRLGSGIYLIRAEQNGLTESRKVTIIR